MTLTIRFPRALLLAAALSSSIQAQGIEGLRDRVKEHSLANGMKFLLLERHTSPTVAFHVYFNVGSVDEDVGQTGIAHLYEHMAFKGTRQIGTTNYEEESKHFGRIDQLQAELTQERDKGAAADKSKIQRLEAELRKETEEAEKYVVPNEVGKLFEENGAARINAQTERDQTHYYLSLPSNKIELWMAIESDRIQNTVLRQLYTERDVVMEELRRTIDTNPINKLLLEGVITTAFHAHPYGLHSGIGWPSDVSHITRAEVERFFKKYYGAANCTVAIVGDFETSKIIPMLDRYFSSAPSGEKNPGVVTVEPPQDGERRIELEAVIQPILALGYHRPNTMSDDDIIYDVLEHLLADGRTSRLYKNLVEGKGIAAEVAALPNPPLVTAKYPSLFEIIGVPVTPTHTVAELERAINDELEKLKTEQVDKQELQKIINQVDYEFVRSLASNETLAELLVFTQGLEGDWKRLLTYRKRLAAVTPDDVMRVCRQTFTRSNRTIAYIVPKEAPKGAAGVAPAGGGDAAPATGPDPAAAGGGEATPESLARGASIMQAARAGLGGEDKTRGIRDYSVGLHATLTFSGQQLEAQAAEQVLLPDKTRTAVSVPALRQSEVQVLNGNTGWIEQGGKSADAPAQAMTQFKESLIRTQLTLFLASPDGSAPRAQALADQNVDGKPVDVVLVTGPEGLKTTLFFDKQAHRLVRALYQSVHPVTQQPSLAQEDYSDYKLEDGFMVPHRTVILMNGEKFSDETLTELKVNTGVPASLFEKK